jgi:xanthine dehydrogenase YagS FAD-binding subunit
MTEARIIAGGTTLVDLMKLGVETPEAFIDIVADGALPSGVEITQGGLRIGALATMAEVAAHPGVIAHYPAIAQSLQQAASPQIRNMATIGGNLMQRTRCTWFRDTSTNCAKRTPGAGCAALDGPGRGMAVLGRGSACIAAYPGDLAIALVAYGASITLRAADGSERVVPVADFYLSPGETPHLETVLAAGEQIVTVHVPNSEWTHSSYTKLRDRAAYAFALASVALCLKTGADGKIMAAKLAIGGLASKPWYCPDAQVILVGESLTPQLADAVANACFAEAEGDAGMILIGKAAVRAALERTRSKLQKPDETDWKGQSQ